ncbi:MAG: class I SAM-dependent methyltransferase [Candidatus Limivicinus sp.]
MLEHSGFPAGSRILDMGAGAGETVQLLRELGYAAVGIDISPRCETVQKVDFLHSGLKSGSFDGIISQCSFFISGDVQRAFEESCRLLKPGGILAYSDVCTEDIFAVSERAGFRLVYSENLTDEWREYYIDALWRGDCDYMPMNKKCGYYMLIFRKE